jgi:thiamine transport system permease protein
MRWRGRRTDWAMPLLLATAPMGLLIVMLVVPALALLGQARELDLTALWHDPWLRGRLLWSLVQAWVTVGITLVLGVPLAWVLARVEFAGRRGLIHAVTLPFVVPTLVAALGVLALWGPHGLLASPLELDTRNSPWPLLAGNVFFNLGLVVRAGVDGLERVSPSRLAAARTLGATPWRAFWRVEWPAMRPWLASALCLVFLYCFSGFGLALVLGGQAWATVDVEIYHLVAHELALDDAAALAVWTLGLTSLGAVGYAWVERHLAHREQAAGVQRIPVARHWRYRAGVLCASAVIAVTTLGPLAAIALRLLQAGAAPWGVLQEPDTLAACGRTLIFASVAVLAATALGLAHACAARHHLLLRAASLLPLVISPVIVAFGLLLAYPAGTASLPLLLACYTVLATPLVAQSVSSALDAQPPHRVQAARTLGASPWRAFWRVTLPGIMPSLRRGMAWAAATALGEFAVTLFLSRPEWTTLTTLMYQRLGRPGERNFDEALVLAATLLLLAGAIMWLIDGPAPGHNGSRSPRHPPPH